MSISATYETVRQIALTEFGEVVFAAEIMRLPTGPTEAIRQFCAFARQILLEEARQSEEE